VEHIAVTLEKNTTLERLTQVVLRTSIQRAVKLNVEFFSIVGWDETVVLTKVSSELGWF